MHTILSLLETMYPNAKTALNHETPFQLLVATILSAQSTDEQVNMITSDLFRVYPDAFTLAQASEESVGKLIKSVGLWRTKARNIVATAEILVREYDGKVPQTRTELEKLPGVGRKTANVVLANAFGVPAIAVDTHVFRVSNRLGLAQAKNPLQTEKQLMKVIPKDQWIKAHHWLIYHGRAICKARNPQCEICPLNPHCQYYQTRHQSD
jgi:endonuclease-3